MYCQEVMYEYVLTLCVRTYMRITSPCLQVYLADGIQLQLQLPYKPLTSIYLSSSSLDPHPHTQSLFYSSSTVLQNQSINLLLAKKSFANSRKRSQTGYRYSQLDIRTDYMGCILLAGNKKNEKEVMVTIQQLQLYHSQPQNVRTYRHNNRTQYCMIYTYYYSCVPYTFYIRTVEKKLQFGLAQIDFPLPELPLRYTYGS